MQAPRGSGEAQLGPRGSAPGRRDSWLNPYALARRRLRAAVARAAPAAHGRLLDIGCGPKPYYEIFRPQVGEYFGIDFPAAGGQRAVPDVLGDALHLPFGAATFDTVLCNEVLEHVPNPFQLLAEAFRVTRPGGVLILTAPQTWGLHEEPRDYYRFTKYGLRHVSEQAGYLVESVHPTTGTWGTVGQRVSSLLYTRHGRGRALALKGLVAGACVLVLLLANALDIAYGRHGDTLDNILVARRPARPQ